MKQAKKELVCEDVGTTKENDSGAVVKLYECMKPAKE
jgi:hypothetical protein